MPTGPLGRAHNNHLAEHSAVLSNVLGSLLSNEEANCWSVAGVRICPWPQGKGNNEQLQMLTRLMLVSGLLPSR